MTDFETKIFQGNAVPQGVGALRYALFINGQGKTYPSADHGRRLLFDEVDLFSTHLLCCAGNGLLLSALRLTPVEQARQHDFFAPLLGHTETQEGLSVILSRLVRIESLAGARSIQPLFKYAFDHCLGLGWTRGLIQTSPRLLPLFARYGWRAAGQEFHDTYAGRQVPLTLDALDEAHLARIGSPYIDCPEITGRIRQCKEHNGARTAI